MTTNIEKKYLHRDFIYACINTSNQWIAQTIYKNDKKTIEMNNQNNRRNIFFSF